MAKRIQFGDDIVKILNNYGFTLHSTDVEQGRDYTTITYNCSFGKKEKVIFHKHLISNLQ